MTSTHPLWLRARAFRPSLGGADALELGNARVLRAASRRFALSSWILSAAIAVGLLGLHFLFPVGIASLGLFAIVYLPTTSIARALTFSGLYALLGIFR